MGEIPKWLHIQKACPTLEKFLWVAGKGHK